MDQAWRSCDVLSERENLELTCWRYFDIGVFSGDFGDHSAVDRESLWAVILPEIGFYPTRKTSKVK